MRSAFGFLGLAAVVLLGCSKKEDATKPSPEAAIKSGPGVDVAQKIIRIGALNDESGPAAAIGKPYALGKRILVERINQEGGLPGGWKLELVEKDHGYNPQQSVQAYGAIKDQVLFLATSFGTPNTLPLRDLLRRDKLVAFPASLSSQMAEHEMTPPLGPSYKVEAMRAMDWAVESAGGAAGVKAAIVYQQDDYGKDGIDGWKQAAEKHGVTVVAAEAVAAGQKDVTAVVTALKGAGATHVLLTTLPSATGPILGTAAQLQYAPVWIGNTPAWIDGFFNPQVIPPPVLANFHWVTGLTYWGEEVPGMKEALDAFQKYGEGAPPNFYIMASYVQGLAEVEILRRALAANDVTREGFLRELHRLDGWDGGGLLQPVKLVSTPYVTSTRTRILKPVLDKKTWVQVAPYADPKAL